METVFVKAVFDVDCKWAGKDPAYRVFVNDELFTERTWVWNNCYFEEILQIQAPPGQYNIKLKPVHSNDNFTVTNHRIEHGSARWIDNQYLEILP